MTSTLSRTLDEVRQAETTHLGNVGRPNPWWPGGPTTNDCVGFQTVQLGLRTGRESLAWLSTPANRHFISISAFRAHYRWLEVPAGQIQPGDLVLSNWTGAHVDGGLEAEHMEWAYSRARDSIVIIGANTGPRPGQLMPNGLWKKTRPLDEHIIRGIRPPYRLEKPTHSRKNVVKAVAAYLNGQDLGPIPRTTSVQDGIEGPNYWRRMQTWGRHHGYYPSQYVIDGIPGAQSRIVETAAYQLAGRAKK